MLFLGLITLPFAARWQGRTPADRPVPAGGSELVTRSATPSSPPSAATA